MDVSVIIDSIKDGRPVRVAVDGRTACGKSTFARALSNELAKRGRSVVHTTIDGFHNPKVVRYARGRMSAEGYYYDARDLAAVRRDLLDPLGPGGHRRIVTETFDLAADQPVAHPSVRFAENGILLVDGAFLARPELADAWDVHIFLYTRRETSRLRGVTRDIAAGGDPAAVETAYNQRYLPAFDLYLSEADPEARADIIIDLEDFGSPSILRMLPPG